MSITFRWRARRGRTVLFMLIPLPVSVIRRPWRVSGPMIGRWVSQTSPFFAFRLLILIPILLRRVKIACFRRLLRVMRSRHQLTRQCGQMTRNSLFCLIKFRRGVSVLIAGDVITFRRRSFTLIPRSFKRLLVSRGDRSFTFILLLTRASIKRGWSSLLKTVFVSGH